MVFAARSNDIWVILAYRRERVIPQFPCLICLTVAHISGGKPPMGLLPILEVDDTVLCSSKAIVGYIAEVTGKCRRL